MSINLTPARRALDDIRRDTCTITLRSDGIEGAVFDDVEERMAYPADEVLYQGACRISTTSEVKANDEYNMPVSIRKYFASLPIDAPDIPPGAILEVTAVDPDMGDPELVGKRFDVRGAVVSSIHVQRKLTLSLRDPETPAQPEEVPE